MREVKAGKKYSWIQKTGVKIFLLSISSDTSKQVSYSSVKEWRWAVGGAYSVLSVNSDFCQLYLSFFSQLQLSPTTKYVLNNS